MIAQYLPPRTPIEESIESARHAQRLSGGDNTKVGATLWRLKNGTYDEIASGSNGLPQGIVNTHERHAFGYFKELDLHGESGLICDAARHGRSIEGASITVTHCPCYECTGMLVEAGIGDVVLDGAQKMRPRFYDKWFSKITRNLNIFEEVGVPVRVHGLRKKQDGSLDLRMTDEEMEEGHGYAISQEPHIVHDMEDGYDLVRRAAEGELKTPPIIRADPWLQEPYVKHSHSGLASRLKNSLSATVRKADELVQERERHPEEAMLPQHVAILLDAQSRPLLSEISRPPRGSGYGWRTQEEAVARSIMPEMLMVAHAARKGIAMEGKQVYLSHYPTNRAAAMLAGAGVRKLTIDMRHMPKTLRPEEANRLWIAHVILAEAGIKVSYLNGRDPTEWIRRQAEDEITKTLKPMLGNFSTHLVRRNASTENISPSR